MTTVVGAASCTIAAKGAIPIRRSGSERMAPGMVSSEPSGTLRARRRSVPCDATQALQPVPMRTVERPAEIPAEQPRERSTLGLLGENARPSGDRLEQPGVIGVHAVRAAFPVEGAGRLTHLHSDADRRAEHLPHQARAEAELRCRPALEADLAAPLEPFGPEIRAPEPLPDHRWRGRDVVLVGNEDRAARRFQALRPAGPTGPGQR